MNVRDTAPIQERVEGMIGVARVALMLVLARTLRVAPTLEGPSQTHHV